MPVPIPPGLFEAPALGRTVRAGLSCNRASCRLLVSDIPYHDDGSIARGPGGNFQKSNNLAAGLETYLVFSDAFFEGAFVPQ